MRARRLFASLLTTTLVASGATALATASPATAATATQIVGGTEGKGWLYRSTSVPAQPGVVVSGESLGLSINVVDADGAQVYDGTLTVQRQLAGEQAWKTVATATSAYLYDSVKAVRNAKYRVLYSGSGDYAPSTAGVAVKVQRKLNDRGISGRKLFLTGKVQPKYKRKPVVIERQHGKKWRTYKLARTNAKSRFRVRVAAPGRVGAKIKYRIRIQGGGGFAPSRSKVYTATKRAYRPAMRG